MAHQTIADFRAGQDRRRDIINSPPGALYSGINVHITSGGDIENRKAFETHAILPAGTCGLAANADHIYTFGPTLGAAPATPTNVIYQAIDHPSALALVRIVGTTMFQGLPYVLAEYSDGSVQHFYNGTIVNAWKPGGAYESYVATACVTLGTKVYVVADSTLFGCEVDDPTKWGTGLKGDFAIDMSTHLEGSVNLSGLAVYVDKLAIFSPRATQIWFVDPDPAKNYLVQTLPNLGTVAGGSITSYGDSDVFLLARNGIRSLRAREQSAANLASSYDIGAPIDPDVKLLVRALGSPEVAKSVCVVDPKDGRYMLAIGTRVFVFSFFPAGQVSAWTEYDLGEPVTAWATLDDRLYAMLDNRIVLYGGVNDDTYDTSAYEVVIPFLDGKSPHTIKKMGGIDIGCTGQWTVEVGMNPNRPDEREVVARVTRSTYGDGRLPADFEGTHMSIRLTGSAPARATLSAIVVHFTPYDDKDNGA